MSRYILGCSLHTWHTDSRRIETSTAAGLTSFRTILLLPDTFETKVGVNLFTFYKTTHSMESQRRHRCSKAFRTQYENEEGFQFFLILL